MYLKLGKRKKASPSLTKVLLFRFKKFFDLPCLFFRPFPPIIAIRLAFKSFGIDTWIGNWETSFKKIILFSSDNTFVVIEKKN